MDVYEEFLKGKNALREGMSHKAIHHLRRAKRAEPSKLSIREALGRAYFMAGRFEMAKREFEFIIFRKPDEDYAYFGLGVSMIRMGEVEEGLERLRIACALNPSNSTYREFLEKYSSRR
jgi:Flp pilus assembly protein TadD